MKVLIAGDFCQKNRVDKVVKERRFGELFDDIKHVVEQADYSIVNFEFPIVLSPSVAKPIKKCGPNLGGTIESIDAIRYAGFKCCTLANNHILDQGEQCCIDTKNELEKVGVDTVGAGKDLEEASRILYKEINGDILAIINCCEHEFSIASDSIPGANPLNPIQQYYKIQEACKNADYVIVIVHGGHEHYQLPSPRMQETYRFFIDAGADAVVNHHQHCYSGYEIYNGKPIFYGLGNLCFDNPHYNNSIWNEGYMLLIDFSVNFKPLYDLIPYTQCKNNPGVFLSKDRALFDKNIKELNTIIANKEVLDNKTKEYYSSGADSFFANYQPYENRILNKLYRMHMLPSQVSQRRFLAIWNYFECEAHRDKQMFAFRKKFNLI